MTGDKTALKLDAPWLNDNWTRIDFRLHLLSCIVEGGGALVFRNLRRCIGTMVVLHTSRAEEIMLTPSEDQYLKEYKPGITQSYFRFYKEIVDQLAHEETQQSGSNMKRFWITIADVLVPVQAKLWQIDGEEHMQLAVAGDLITDAMAHAAREAMLSLSRSKWRSRIEVSSSEPLPPHLEFVDERVEVARAKHRRRTCLIWALILIVQLVLAVFNVIAMIIIYG